MSKAPPAYQMYARDFDASTAAWTLEEVGAYLRLLNHQWEQGFVPSDMASLAALLRVNAQRARSLWRRKLREKFPEGPDGRRRNERLEQVRGDRQEWGSKSSDGGKRSARLRAARRFGRHSERQWHELLVAVGWRCPRCGDDQSPLERDHVIPLYQGGSDRIENIQPLCHRCNTAKGPERTDCVAHIRGSLNHPPNHPINHPSTTAPTSGQHSVSYSLSEGEENPTPTPPQGEGRSKGKGRSRRRPAHLGPEETRTGRPVEAQRFGELLARQLESHDDLPAAEALELESLAGVFGLPASRATLRQLRAMGVEA